MNWNRDRQGYLHNRLRHYAEQKDYLARLQSMYREMKMIFRALHAAYEEYRQGHLDPALLEKITFLQNQLKDIRREIAIILGELKKLEERNQV